MHLYEKIARNLEQAIRSGKYKVGDLLPSEKKLMDIYDVSRITIRNALKLLESKGLIRKIQGKGALVNETIFWYPNHLISFTKDMEIKGKKSFSKVLEKKVVKGSDLGILNLRENIDLFKLKRIRFTDDEPVALQIHFVRYDFVPGIESLEFSRRSLYDTLENDYGLEISHVEQEIKARMPTEEEFKLLGMNPDIPVFFVKSKIYMSEGIILAWGFSIFKSDKYAIRLILRK